MDHGRQYPNIDVEAARCVWLVASLLGAQQTATRIKLATSRNQKHQHCYCGQQSLHDLAVADNIIYIGWKVRRLFSSHLSERQAA